MICEPGANAIGLHAFAEVLGESSPGSHDAVVVWDGVERLANVGCHALVRAHVVEAVAGGRDDVVELALRFGLGLSEGHLHAAMSVDLTFSRGFDGKVDHVFEVVDHS